MLILLQKVLSSRDGDTVRAASPTLRNPAAIAPHKNNDFDSNVPKALGVESGAKEGSSSGQDAKSSMKNGFKRKIAPAEPSLTNEGSEGLTGLVT